MARFPEIKDEKNDKEDVSKEKKEVRWYQKDLNLNISIGGVSPKDVLFFTKNLSVMLKAGSTLSESLEVIQEEVDGKLKNIVQELHDNVSKGLEFSEALSDYPKVFSDTYVSVIKVGEKTGSLGKNLEYLVDQLQKNESLKKKILGAMFYPAVVVLGGLSVSLGIVIFVLPKITTIFKNFDVDLPWTTQLLISLSDFFQSYGLESAIGGVVLVVFFYWFLKRDFIKPVTHWLILKIPVVKEISKHFNLTMFFRTLSILLSSGVTIDEGLKISRKTVSNVKYKDFIEKAHREVKGGGSLTTFMKERPDLFPATNVQIIKVGEDSGTLSDSLDYCSTIHQEGLDDLTKNLSDILEPILLIAIGLLIGFLALSIITPIYSITGEFRA